MSIAAVQAINKILQTKDFSIIKQNGLDESYFRGYTKQFNFIEEHFKKFGNIPDDVTFLEKFPKWIFTEVNETDEYLLDRLYDDACYYQFSTILPKIANMAEEDSRAAYEFMKSKMNDMKPHTVCKGVDIMANAMEK